MFLNCSLFCFKLFLYSSISDYKFSGYDLFDRHSSVLYFSANSEVIFDLVISHVFVFSLSILACSPFLRISSFYYSTNNYYCYYYYSYYCYNSVF